MMTSDILRQLVAFNTISSQSNLALIDWVESLLVEHGMFTERLEDEEGLAKASLIARVGPEAEGGLILSGHTDVVPVEGQPWLADPFVMRETDDRYIGRGVCDMKGFIASALAGALRWQQQPLQQPVYLALSYDEEVGCDKAPRIAQRLIDLGAQQAWAIIGEPSSMKPVVGHKGIVSLRTTLTGVAAHSSQLTRQGVSAVHAGAMLVTRLEQIMQDLVAAGHVDTRFNVPHSTLHVGQIRGGIARNVLARDCVLDWEIRNLPQDDIAAVMRRVEQEVQRLCHNYPDLRVETVYDSAEVPGLADKHNDDLLALLIKHTQASPSYVSYATEAGHFQQAGFQTVICGPGSIAQAHQPEEWIAKSQLATCDAVLDALVGDVCV